MVILLLLLLRNKCKQLGRIEVLCPSQSVHHPILVFSLALQEPIILLLFFLIRQFLL